MKLQSVNPLEQTVVLEVVPRHGSQRPERKLNREFCVGEFEMQGHPRDANHGWRYSERNEQAEEVTARPPEVLMIALPEVRHSG
jgi:hypothetical protein